MNSHLGRGLYSQVFKVCYFFELCSLSTFERVSIVLDKKYNVAAIETINTPIPIGEPHPHISLK